MLQAILQKAPEEPLRVLCLGAHSDDIEIGCGGTILKLAAARRGGMEVRWVVFSGRDRRAEEAQGSAEAMLAGVEQREIRVESFRDGFFPSEGDRIKEYFEALKKDSTPDLILTHFREDRHQDHRVISDLTWNTFRDHLVLEYEIPKYDGDLQSPNAYVPLEGAVCRQKADLLIEHFGSQRSKHWFSEDLFLGLMRIRGMECGSASGYAEGFYCRKICLG